RSAPGGQLWAASSELAFCEQLTTKRCVIPATFAARGNTQFDQEFLNLFRAETVSAYDWRDRIGDLCVAEYLAQLDTVHLVRYSTSLSLHFGMVAPIGLRLVFIKLIHVVAMLV